MEPYTEGVTETPSTTPMATSRLFSAAAAIGDVIDAARDVVVALAAEDDGMNGVLPPAIDRLEAALAAYDAARA